MDNIEWARKKGELSSLARFAVTKVWRLHTEWQQADLLFRGLASFEFVRSIAGLHAIALYLWSEFGEREQPSLPLDERRQAKAHLN